MLRESSVSNIHNAMLANQGSLARLHFEGLQQNEIPIMEEKTEKGLQESHKTLP